MRLRGLRMPHLPSGSLSNWSRGEHRVRRFGQGSKTDAAECRRSISRGRKLAVQPEWHGSRPDGNRRGGPSPLCGGPQQLRGEPRAFQSGPKPLKDPAWTDVVGLAWTDKPGGGGSTLLVRDSRKWGCSPCDLYSVSSVDRSTSGRCFRGEKAVPQIVTWTSSPC